MKWKWNLAQQAEWRWWKNYLGEKDRNTYVAWKKNYWNAFLQRLKTNTGTEARGKIADLGCGPAGIYLVLAPFEVLALDPLLDKYREEHLLCEPGPDTRVQFVCSSLEQPGLSQKFDTVFCLNAINHVADLELALKQIFELTQKGGQVILSTDAHRRHWVARLFRAIPADLLHPQQYTTAEYRQWFEKAGFQWMSQYTDQPGRIFDYVVFRLIRP